MKDDSKRVSGRDSRTMKNGGRKVAELLTGEGESWDMARERGFAGLDLKTKQRVLIRILSDTRQFERERQLQALLDPRCGGGGWRGVKN